MYNEISRSVVFHSHFESGIASIDAEICIEGEEGNIYLHTEWVSEADDELSFEATTESVFSINERIFCAMIEGDSIEAEVKERERIVANRVQDDSNYHEYYEELKIMVNNELTAHGYDQHYT